MFDLDHFKHINDQYGHATGDQVLATIAEICRLTIRESDILARLGGEEFAILLPQTPKEQATILADRIRRAIESQQTSPVCTASLGVSCTTQWQKNGVGGPELDELLSAADRQLFVAKRNGRNQIAG